ncbi:winged helix-turn-helix transcriptional regulator [Candidatus Dojkabacteria bacterium]|nr:winged helix-turn-helix transcriptional regulator [Candidatus Dojkabacteria bacterium]
MKEYSAAKIIQLRKLLAVNRIKILSLLVKEDTCVCQMVRELDLKHSLISHHLKTLIDLGIIESTRNGKHMIYQVVPEKKQDVRDILHLAKLK